MGNDVQEGWNQKEIGASLSFASNEPKIIVKGMDSCADGLEN